MVEAYKKIGLIGGMSPTSTAAYYEQLTEEFRRAGGGGFSGEIILYSVNFQKIVDGLAEQNWESIRDTVMESYYSLKAAGAEVFAIASNTIHRVSSEIEEECGNDFIHILKPTIEFLTKRGVSKVGLIGTKHTMNANFYLSYLKSHKIEVLAPSSDEQELLHTLILERLCKGYLDEGKPFIKSICDNLCKKGAEGIILGCTELPLVINPKELCSAPIANTIQLHIQAMIAKALLKY